MKDEELKTEAEKTNEENEDHGGQWELMSVGSSEASSNDRDSTCSDKPTNY